MARTIEKEYKVGTLTATAFYIGIGAILHLILLGATIDWSSAWTYAIVLGWPFVVMGIVIVAFAAVALVAFLILGIAHYVDTRKRQKSAEKRKSERLKQWAEGDDNAFAADSRTLN